MKTGFLAFAAGPVGLAVLLGCGGGGSKEPAAPAPAPVATSLTASSLTPARGGTFTLTPVYSAGTGSIDNGITCPATGMASSAITANWSGARVYTLTVTNADNKAAATSVTVTPQTVGVGAVSPAAPTVMAGSTTTFSCTVTGGATGAVSWAASAGIMDASTGTWTAPTTTGGPYTITATAMDDPTKTATTTVTVTPARMIAFADVGALHTGAKGGTLAIALEISGVDDPSLTLVPSAGTISDVALTNGVTAAKLHLPTTAGTVTVTATSVAQPSLNFSAMYTVAPGPVPSAPGFQGSNGATRYPWYATWRGAVDGWTEISALVEGHAPQPIIPAMWLPENYRPVTMTISGGGTDPVVATAFSVSSDASGNKIWRPSTPMVLADGGADHTIVCTDDQGNTCTQRLYAILGTKPRLLGPMLNETPNARMVRLPGEPLTAKVDLGTFPGFTNFSLFEATTGALVLGQSITQDQALDLTQDDFTVADADSGAPLKSRVFGVGAARTDGYSTGPTTILPGAIRYSVNTSWYRDAGAWSMPGKILTGGQALVVGGKVALVGARDTISGNVIREIGLYDPKTEQWSTLATLPYAPDGAAAVAVGSWIVVLGGRDATGNPTSNGFTITPNGVVTQDRDMVVPRADFGAVVLADGHTILAGWEEILNSGVAGGDGLIPPPPFHRAGKAILQPSSKWIVQVGGDANAFAQVLVPGTPYTWQTYPLGAARLDGFGLDLLPDSSIVITGGTDSSGNILGGAEILDRTFAVTPLAQPILGAIAGTKNHATLVLPDGRLLLSGGVDGAGNAAIAQSGIINFKTSTASVRNLIHPTSYSTWGINADARQQGLTVGTDRIILMSDTVSGSIIVSKVAF